MPSGRKPEVQYPGQPGAVQPHPQAGLCGGAGLWARIRAGTVPVQGDAAGHTGHSLRRQEAQGMTVLGLCQT